MQRVDVLLDNFNLKMSSVVDVVALVKVKTMTVKALK